MASIFSKKSPPSKFKEVNKSMRGKNTIKIRFLTQSTEDHKESINDPFSMIGISEFNLEPTQTLLGKILKRGVTHRNRVMKTLKTQMDRSNSFQNVDSCTKPRLKKQQKENIKSLLRRSVTRQSTTRQKEDQQKKKLLKQSFNKIVKELKHKTYARRQSENNKAKITIQSYGATIKGHRHNVNQDSICFSQGIFIICDGHGTNGKQISKFVSQTGHSTSYKYLGFLLEAYNEKKIDTYQIRNILKKVELELDISGIDISFSGCTFIGIIIFENSIFCISIGDSKSILCNRIITSQLNTLHKPDHPTEKDRIEACGGVIHPLEIGKDKYSGPNRIWAPGKNSWGPGLALSRALGDKAAKKYGLSSEPEIKNIQLSYDADFIVLGSDGLFDFLKDSQISFFIRKKLKEEGYDREKISSDLVEEARRVGGLDSDDISCIIIFL